MRELLESPSGSLILLGIVVVLALLALLNAGSDSTRQSGLRRAIAFFSGFLIASVCARALETAQYDEAARYVRVASYLLLVFAALRLITSAAVWIIRTRRGRVTPKILRDVVDAGLYLVAIAVVLRFTLKVDLGSLLATSAIFSVVAGLALQETLGSLFAGLALQVEPPFVVGDWISVGPHTGQVLQVAWRQIRIATVRREIVTIPNSAVAKEHVVNFTRGGAIARDLFLEIDYGSPPNAVKAACLDVLASHPKIRASPAPSFMAVKWEASGIQYRARFFADRFDDIDALTDEVLGLLWYRVGREGFTIPYPTRKVIFEASRKAADPGKDRTDPARLLEGIEFLKPLGKEGLARLAPLATVQHFASGEEVVRQGEKGEAFYLIISGAALQRVEGAKEEPARLGPGDCFGETALLSDAPHEVTVSALGESRLLCVKRAAVKDALRGQDDASRALAQALAGRKARPPSRG